MKDRAKRENFKRLRELLEYKVSIIKGVYEEIDEVTNRLLEAGHVAHRFKDGHRVDIVDNFGEKNVQFRPAKFARFEAKLIPPDKG